MEIDLADTMNSLFLTSTWLLALLLLFALILHINNQNRIYSQIYKLTHKNGNSNNSSKDSFRESFYKEITVSQGSNFTALALASWILLVVAAAFLYLLVPTIFPYSYMNIAELASNPLGFFIFGIIVGVLTAAIILLMDKLPENHRELKLMELYSFYSLSKGMKKTMGMTIIALSISVFSSAYVGTIYPSQSVSAEILSLLMLIVSAMVLVMPIYKEAWGLRR